VAEECRVDLEPTQEKVEASHMEEEEDHEHLSVSESEAKQSKHRKGNVSDTTEGGLSGLQSEDGQSDVLSQTKIIVHITSVILEIECTSHDLRPSFHVFIYLGIVYGDQTCHALDDRTHNIMS